MNIKLCGHHVRLEKPIKIYSFFKHSALTLVLMAVFIAPSYAGEIKASSENVEPCLISPAAGMEKAVEKEAPVSRTQRTAGSSSVSAMALVLALGLRDVHGPLERAATESPQRQGGLK